MIIANDKEEIKQEVKGVNIPSDLAAYIVGHRKDAGLSRAKLSALSGVPVRTIEDWESGVRLPRDVWQIWKIASALNLTIEEYLGLGKEVADE